MVKDQHDPETFYGERSMVSCGCWHMMAVTAAGHAWTCGYNLQGQLGMGDTAHRLGFTQVDAGQLGGARIVMAASGWCHSVVVSADGRVWTFGHGDDGSLGHNDEQSRLVPTLLAAEVFKGSKIVTVVAGGNRTMAVGVNGALWDWGAGSYGQLVLGDTNDRRVPTLVGAEEALGGSQVRTIACDCEHTLAVTEAGELLVWGRGAQGRLGLDDEQDRLVPTRVDPHHFAHAPASAPACRWGGGGRGGVGDFSGVRMCRGLPCTWGCEGEGVRREMRCCKTY